MKTFQELNLDASILRAITELGFEEATPIQEKTIPIGMEGRDLIGQAQTGTGKTAAFSIPLLSRIEAKEEKIVALVMTPTRELAIQVSEEIGKLSRFKGIRTLPIYGGQDIGKQIRALRARPQVIIGTPGRLIDHIERKTIKLEDVRMVVLDEADEMLDMGFMEDIQSILKQTPDDRQTMLFSATMPPNIQKLAQQFLKNPEHVSVIPKQVTVPLIDQAYIEVHERQKFEALCRLIDMESPELAIIFGRTKRRVSELTEALQKRGYSADGLHGDLSQFQRDTVMRKFRDNNIEVLVATDVAARGLDVSGVTHVVNFDLPQDPESYVHRIGRTGRAGKEGTAWSFVTPREVDHLHFIEKVTRQRIPKKPLPTFAEAMEGKQQMIAESLVEIMESDKITQYKRVVARMLDEYDSVPLLAAAFHLIAGERNESQEIELTPEEPVRVKRRQPDRRRMHGAGGNGGHGGQHGADGHGKAHGGRNWRRDGQSGGGQGFGFDRGGRGSGNGGGSGSGGGYDRGGRSGGSDRGYGYGDGGGRSGSRQSSGGGGRREGQGGRRERNDG